MKILTFNIRYPEPGDGPDRWEFRREMAAAVIGSRQPEVVGLQEPVLGQLHDFERLLPEYARFGVSRYGNQDEKFTAVLCRRDALELIESGAFWFSATPDAAATMSWGVHKPYAVNWGRLRDRAGREFRVFNSHFPYKPEQAEARLRSAELLRDRAMEGAGPVFLTGDFNSPAGGPVHTVLTQRFRDAWVEAGERLGPEDTMHGFTGFAAPGRRIDWVLFRGEVRVSRVETITDSVGGRYPSDHFPVLAEVDW